MYKTLVIPYTKLNWSSVNCDVPVSPVFDDVYFSVQDGVAESFEHFIKGNNLPARFASLDSYSHFTILETGFGSGLNLLLAADLFLKVAPKTARLHFVSVEGYPLNPDDMNKILDLALHSDNAKDRAIDKTLKTEILKIYPPNCRGFHRREIRGGRINLTLYMGDIKGFIESVHTYDSGIIDAVFLDGFSPAKNPDMWHSSLFAKLPWLIKTNGTIATFTSAGFVRRGLQDNGFSIEKKPGFGKKRERLTGVYKAIKPEHIPPKTVAVIGAGIAGLTVAHKCQKLGAEVVIFNAGAHPMAGASGNPVALIEPHLVGSNKTPRGRLNLTAYLNSIAYYDNLQAISQKSVWSCKGIALFPKKETLQKRLQKVLDSNPLPPNFLQLISDDKMKDFVPYDTFSYINNDGKPVVFLPNSGGIYPKSVGDILCRNLRVKNGVKIDAMNRENGQWILYDKDNKQMGHFDAVIVCAGVNSLCIKGIQKKPYLCYKNLRANRGQLSWAKSKLAFKIALSGNGYTTYNRRDKTVIFGATWDRLTEQEYEQKCWNNILEDDHIKNREKTSDLLTSLKTISPCDIQGRVAVRATVSDNIPIVGEIQKGVFINTGYGARGFQYAPLFAQMCTDILWNLFCSCDHEIIQSVHPQRFLKEKGFDTDRSC